VKSLMPAIWTEDCDTQPCLAHWIIHIPKPQLISGWPESNLADRKLLVQMSTENAHNVDLEGSEEEQAQLITLQPRYTSCGALGAWRVLRWRLGWYSLELRDTKHRNDIAGQ